MTQQVGAGPYRQLIGGELVEGGNGTYEIVNPATEQVVAEAPEASVADVQAAAAAQRPPSLRGRHSSPSSGPSCWARCPSGSSPRWPTSCPS